MRKPPPLYVERLHLPNYAPIPRSSWGDGEQTRSFCYIDDGVDGLHRLVRFKHLEPLNLGQDRMVSINQLADMIADIAGVRIRKLHIPGPQGVRGRNSDSSLLRAFLNSSPTVTLEVGLSRTYQWVEEQVQKALSGKEPRLTALRDSQAANAA